MTMRLNPSLERDLKKAMRIALAVLSSAAALLAPFHGRAQQSQAPLVPVDVRGDFSYDGDILDADGNTAYVSMELRVALFTLMGEPVVYCTGRWRLRSVKVNGVTHNEAGLPAEVWRGIDLVAVNFAFPLSLRLGSDRYGSASVPCDPGVFYAHGDKRASFNVPGSPSWDRTLLRHNWHQATIGLSQDARKKAIGQTSSYVPTAEVKDWLVKRQASFTVESRDAPKGTLTGIDLITGSVNLWPVRAWAQEQQRLADAKKADAKRAATAPRTSKDSDAPAGPAAKMEDMFAEVDAVQGKRDEGRIKEQAAAGRRAMAAKAAQLKQGECAPDPKVLASAVVLRPVDPTSLLDAVDQAVRRHAACDRSEVFITAGSDELIFRNKQGASLLVLPRSVVNSVGKVSDGLFRATATKEEISRLGLPVASRYETQENDVGYMNMKGEWVIRPRFNQATSFSNGFALATMTSPGGSSKAYGIIGREGEWLSERKFYCAEQFSEGAAVVSGFDNCRADFYLIDTKGVALFPERLAGLRPLSGGLAAARTKDAWGYIDRSGKWVLSASYSDVGEAFVDGISWACTSYQACDVIDASGRKLSTRILRMPLGKRFSEGLLSAPNTGSNERGYVDRTGQWAIDPKFYMVEEFENGTAWASLGSCQAGRINRQGNWVQGSAPKCGSQAPALILNQSSGR